jgi:protein CMS1
MTATRQTGGDDLDDGLELDPTLLASDSEDGFNEDEDDIGFMSEDEEPVAAPKNLKRKAGGDSEAEDDEDEDEDDVAAPGGEDAAAAKRRKRREKDKARRAAKAARNGDAAPASVDPTRLPREELAALLLASVRSAMPKGTPMEIDDVAVPGA